MEPLEGRGCSMAVSLRSPRTSCMHLQLELKPLRLAPSGGRCHKRTLIGHFVGIYTMLALESTHQWSTK